MRVPYNRTATVWYLPENTRRFRVGDRVATNKGNYEIVSAECEVVTETGLTKGTGFLDSATLKVAFVMHWDRPWVNRQHRYLVDHGVEEHDATRSVAQMLQPRYDDYWAVKPLWRLGIRPADMPRLLAPAARPRGSEHGYTSNRHAALPDEPEAIDTALLADHWVRRSEGRYAEARDERAQTALSMPLAIRISAAKRTARVERRDVSRETFLVARAIAENRPEAAIERRVRNLEHSAYRAA